MSNANEPAFPSIEYDQNNGHYEGRYDIHAQHSGLTKREYFALEMMKVFLAETGRRESLQVVASDASTAADDLLAALDAKPAA